MSTNELTAEQVREAIFNGSGYASFDGAKYYADGIGMQAIADELNAKLDTRADDYRQAAEYWQRMYEEAFAERTCECVAEYAKSPIDGKAIVLHRCSACHELMRPHMAYCPCCGAKVVSE